MLYKYLFMRLTKTYLSGSYAWALFDRHLVHGGVLGHHHTP